ncbi:hypothetical protein [Dyadobacter sp. 3J3]|uniref:hypothetical protein n=1 Tax=Dyadobacter sp. 3J3 TaxID=2606600 RepID=UPI00135C747B|nr:hypothetical protein [Dyadobacter sp. 3J3]
MKILEKDLENMLSTDNTEILIRRGLTCFDHKVILKQVDMGAYGIADVVGISSTDFLGENTIQVSIYELKKDQIGFGAFGQACRYEAGLVKYFREKCLFEDYMISYCIVLIGASIDLDSNFIFAAGSSCRTSCYTYSVDIEGVHFVRSNFEDFIPTNLVDDGFGGLTNMNFRDLFQQAVSN